MFRPALRRCALLVLVPLVAVGLPATAEAVTTPNTIVVDVSSDSIAADGDCSLREALTNAITNTALVAGLGECAAGRSDVEDVIRWGFSAPFSSIGSPLPTVTGTDPLRLAGEPTISDPNPIITGGGLTHLLTVDGGDLTLEKITLAGAVGGPGSALNLTAGQVKLDQANIAANSGTGPGAIVNIAAGSTLSAVDTTFVNNTASGTDATVVHAAGDLTIADGVLTLTDRAGTTGAGGISAVGSTVSLSDFELSDNAGTGLTFTGGADATLTRVDLIRNVSRTSCGGIRSEESTLTWTQGEVFGNETLVDGGGVCLLSTSGAGSSRLSRVSITNNHAANGNGGGLLVGTDDVQLGNVTISENTAAEAGALMMAPLGPTPTAVLLANVTVADNLNEQLGGTAVVVVGSGGALTTSNTIISRNMPSDVATGANATATHDHGIIAQDVSAIIGRLDRNGGFPDYLTHGLLPTAGLALDKGLQATCELPIVATLDARGFGRPIGKCDIGAVERDVTAPSVSGAALTVAAGQVMSGSSMTGRFAWTGSDAGLGVRAYRVQLSTNGGPWSTIALTQAKSVLRPLPSGKTYRFRVRGEDFDGNISPWATTSAYGAKIVQQNSSAVTWTGTWTTASSANVSGGSVRKSIKAGSSATLTAKARGFSLIATKLPTSGKVRIYVDGTLRATVDLQAPATRYRSQVWSMTFTSSKIRKLKVVVLGTSGRPRVDVDAFALLL